MKPIRPRTQWILAALVFVALALASPRWFRRANHHPAPPVPAPTRPVTQPIVSTTAASSPKSAYLDLVRQFYPLLESHRPPDSLHHLKQAARIVLPHPMYLDPWGNLWLTDPKAGEVSRALRQAADHQVHVTPLRPVYAHWSAEPDGRWTPTLICPTRAAGVWDIHSAWRTGQLRTEAECDFARAFPWDQRIVVPAGARVVIIEPENNWQTHISPALAHDGAACGPIQVLLDWRGVIAWIPAANGTKGGHGVVRFADGRWQHLGAKEGWPDNIVQLVPLLDGSVLQILAGSGEQVSFGLASVDRPKVDEALILRLVAQLSDADPAARDAAYEQLTRFGPALWPIIDKVMDEQLAETKVRLRDLLAAKVGPTLGGMKLIEPRMKLVSRHADGGVLFYLDKGVEIPCGDGQWRPQVPAWLWIRPGQAIRPLHEALARQIDPQQTQLLRCGEEWVTVDAIDGLRYLLGNELVPLLGKAQRQFIHPVGIDRHGRWLLRQSADAAGPTLIIDPTLPDPRPRLPVWLIQGEDQVVGWTRDNWPARRSGGAWALEANRWRPLGADEPFYSDMKQVPATQATTQPGALLVDKSGRRYFGGQTALRIVEKDGRDREYPLPPLVQGTLQPVLIEAEGRLLLFNEPGRIVRLRYDAGAAAGLAVEATFAHRIPVPQQLMRLWLDPAGRIIMAYDRNKLAVLFPAGYIPKPIWDMMPASEQDQAMEME